MRYSEGMNTTGVSDLASGRGHEGTRTNRGSRITYITEKHVRQHHLSMRRARLLGYWLRLACSCGPAGFKSTSLSKVWLSATFLLLEPDHETEPESGSEV